MPIFALVKDASELQMSSRQVKLVNYYFIAFFGTRQ